MAQLKQITQSRPNSSIRSNLLERFVNMCPIISHLRVHPTGKHRKIHILAGFLLGVFMSISLYKCVITGLELDPYISITLGVIITTMLTVGCAFSIQIRCICLLAIPTFLGRAGRSVLRALVLGYIIAGPIFNLTYNGKEIIRTFACTTELTYNLTKTRLDLMFKPFKKSIITMKNDAQELKNTLIPVKDLMSPIVEEIEGENEMRRMKEENDYDNEFQQVTSMRKKLHGNREKKNANASQEASVYEMNYKKKVESRCEEQLYLGSERCKEMFRDAYDKCYNKVSGFVAWLLCWPMKLSFVCNLVQALGGSSICNPEGKVSTEIGEGYMSLKSARKKYSQSLKEGNLQYKVEKIPFSLEAHDAMDVAGAVIHEFNIRKKFINTIITIMQRCLSFIFLKIIMSSQKYHDKYLTEVNYDNVYITTYFRKIDARRKANGRSTLLPLKKLEQRKFIDPYCLKPGESEKPYITGQMLKIIVEVIIATTFILLDRLFYESLDLIRRHAYMEYSQAGKHDIVFNVRGTSVIASLLRRLIEKFNVKKRVKTVASNSACLPQPKELPRKLIIEIYGLYVALWILLLAVTYIQRTRRIICGFFYYKREKRRILYLYNETLRRRIGYVKLVKAKIKALRKIRRFEYNLNPWMAFRIWSPTLCSWLHIFTCARGKCSVCNEPEPKKKSTFYKCMTLNCHLMYCNDCWRDIGHICYGCADLSDTDSDEYNTDYVGVKS